MPVEKTKLLDNLLFFFFTLFIFSSTFSIAAAQISFGFSLLTFLVIIIAKHYNPFCSKLKNLYIVIGLYIAWLLFTSVIGPTPKASMFLVKEDWLFLIIPVGIYLLCREEYRHKIITTWAVGVLLVSVYAVIQHFTGEHWFKDDQLVGTSDYGFRVEGNFSIPITFGNYYGTASLFLLGFALKAGKSILGNRYYLIFSASLLGILASILSLGRGVILAIVAAVIVMGFILGRRYLVKSVIILAITIAAVATVSPGLGKRFTGEMARDIKGVYEGSRVFIWNNSLKIIRDHPLFGVAPGNFKTVYTSHLRADIPESRKHAHAHNDLLNIAAVSGIPGALIFGAVWFMVFSFLWKGWKRWRDEPLSGAFIFGSLLASTVFFISALTEATFADEEVRQMLMFVWAAGLWQWYNEKTGKNHNS